MAREHEATISDLQAEVTRRGAQVEESKLKIAKLEAQVDARSDSQQVGELPFPPGPRFLCVPVHPCSSLLVCLSLFVVLRSCLPFHLPRALHEPSHTPFLVPQLLGQSPLLYMAFNPRSFRLVCDWSWRLHPLRRCWR